MEGIVRVGGYDNESRQISLATPRASKGVSVYGLSVDVLFFELALDRQLRIA